MKNIIIIIRENPRRSIFAIIGVLVAIFALPPTIRSCGYAEKDYLEKHTPKLEIADINFYFQPLNFPGGNITGAQVKIVNQSSAWAKNVKVDFINDNGYSKYEKLKYLSENNMVVIPKEIPPNGYIVDGWLPQGAANSPMIYQNGEKKYKVDIFLNWENDQGERYSLVVGYESISDNFNKQVRFRRVYRYDTFNDRNKITEIKKINKGYLPNDML